MVMSSETLFESLRLDMAEEKKEFLFIISLLGTTIQDGGIEKRNNKNQYKYQ